MPRAADPEEPERCADFFGPGPPPATRPRRMSTHRTILVVDDIPLMRAMLAKYIRRLSAKLAAEGGPAPRVEVVEAPNGEVALEELRARRVDLVFLDLMMPVMDGLTFLQQKGENAAIAEIPVIVCSALGDQDVVQNAKALGASSYLVKPFTLDSVEKMYRSHFGERDV